MSRKHWEELLSQLKVTGELVPRAPADVRDFEKISGVKFPKSYRSFCEVVGPGEFADWYTTATPACAGVYPRRYDLATKTKFYLEGREWAEYSSNPEQYQRAIFFADDSATAIYFWDPAEPSPQESEYKIYVQFRDWTVFHLCDSFADFVDVCLKRKAGNVHLYDSQPEMTFRAAQCEKRSRKKKT